MIDIETLLSKRRLDSYDGDLQTHLENLKLIGKYTHKIALIEIALRNSLDYLLSAKDADWINNSTDSRVIQVREKALESSGETTLSNDSYLSKMTLGTVIHIIKREGLFARVFNAERFSLNAMIQAINKKGFSSKVRKVTWATITRLKWL
ncbi:hypothetical protein NHP21005_03130 [Helicobacter sp. NHP21005]|uniref:hypothetical protein n=1 Tax=Helicobacter felistomachi TaxID=3040201 RepID=UPI002572427E|nr:hypothetical protein [Helicobacter sp. NHP21005]BEG56625.1 hypothetical protein NHP21005_03130 [Helicobacter sp. NHP21005]